jgi:hypothetical protein
MTRTAWSGMVLDCLVAHEARGELVAADLVAPELHRSRPLSSRLAHVQLWTRHVHMSPCGRAGQRIFLGRKRSFSLSLCCRHTDS